MHKQENESKREKQQSRFRKLGLKYKDRLQGDHYVGVRCGNNIKSKFSLQFPCDVKLV
jgi:hypothetical protein